MQRLATFTKMTFHTFPLHPDNCIGDVQQK